MFHIAYCFDLAYEQHFGASVCSLLLTYGGAAADLAIHVVREASNIAFERKVRKLADIFGATIDVNVLSADDLAQVRNLTVKSQAVMHATSATYYRLLLPEIVPQSAEQVLYLDSDTIVLSDVSPLLQTDMQGKALGGVVDLTGKEMAERLKIPQYVNAGVLLFDLRSWRANDYGRKCIEFARSNPNAAIFADQCLINIVLANDVFTLEPKWNRFVTAQHSSDDAGDAAILHFIMADKPWHAWYENELARYYWKYLDVSPWADAKPVAPKTVEQALRQARLFAQRRKPDEAIEIYENILSSMQRGRR